MIKRLGAVIALAMVAGAASAPAHARSIDFDKGWRFALVNRAGITDPTGAFANAQDPGYDDSSWRGLDLPHDWSIELDPTNAPDSGTNSGTGFLQAAWAGTARRSRCRDRWPTSGSRSPLTGSTWTPTSTSTASSSATTRTATPASLST
jgi:hypothetical protein